MEKWVALLTVTFMITKQLTSQQTNNYGCSYETIMNNGKKMTCTNVTSSFFQYSSLNLLRSRWLICKNCNLSTITHDTFNFPKNTIGYLVLVDNYISSIDNSAFAKIPRLKLLNLRENLLTNFSSEIFHGVEQLLHLDLGDNRLENLTGNVFLQLENLDILNLNFNRINSIDQAAFNGLINLKYLYLNHNKIEKLENNTFKDLTNLKILYLESNVIKEIHPLAFNKLINLNYLYLNNNSISFLHEYNFKPLSNLVDLQIRFNNLTEIDTSTFNGLKNIKFLYLGRNNLKTIRPYGLIGLNSLEVLELISNKFEYFTVDCFKDMENLNMIWLENNEIVNFSVEQLAQIQPSIKILNLVENRLEFFNYKVLHRKMPRLEEIYIGENPWKCDFILEMYDYFRDTNVSMCTTTCNSSAITQMIREICFEPFQNETDFTTDFVMDCGAKNRINVSLLLVLLILWKCIVVPAS